MIFMLHYDSINGKHRANIIKEKFYPSAIFVHIEVFTIEE
jgi:hypothetical protein